MCAVGTAEGCFDTQRHAGTVTCAVLAKDAGESTIRERSRQKKCVKPDLLDHRQSSGLVEDRSILTERDRPFLDTGDGDTCDVTVALGLCQPTRPTNRAEATTGLLCQEKIAKTERAAECQSR